MRWPREVQEFCGRGWRGNFVVKDDGVAKFPDAEAKEHPENERELLIERRAAKVERGRFPGRSRHFTALI
jgi:hypothetical protein